MCVLFVFESADVDFGLSPASGSCAQPEPSVLELFPHVHPSRQGLDTWPWLGAECVTALLTHVPSSSLCTAEEARGCSRPCFAVTCEQTSGCRRSAASCRSPRLPEIQTTASRVDAYEARAGWMAGWHASYVCTPRWLGRVRE